MSTFLSVPQSQGILDLQGDGPRRRVREAWERKQSHETTDDTGATEGVTADGVVADIVLAGLQDVESEPP